MTQTHEPLPAHMSEPSRIGQEISITGKWVPTKAGGRFRGSAESKEMLQEWEDIHAGARSDDGVLFTEINHTVGEDAVLVHHTFESADALGHYFSTTATEHMGALTAVAKPELHMVRGVEIPTAAQDAIRAKGVDGAFGEFQFGYVKDDYRRQDHEKAINVTAKWTAHPGTDTNYPDLRYWWQRVGTEAFDLEKGLIRFEVYDVVGEDALIIHETFEDTNELKFHLSKGTAERYKKDIDAVAAPEAYFFRGPVSWTIRTYSKFLHLPATYSSQGSNFTRPGGSMIDGTT